MSASKTLYMLCMAISLISIAYPCVVRSNMIARGQDWVDRNISYSQTTTYGGYRMDCSGFVSMCWGLNTPGKTTMTLGTVSTVIAKQSLQAGDALLCPGTHVVLFVSWVNSTHYTGMEETSAKNGTVKRTIPYPFWTNKQCYFPIKYNDVC